MLTQHLLSSSTVLAVLHTSICLDLLTESPQGLMDAMCRLQARISMLTAEIYEVSQDLDSRGRRLAPFAQRIRDIIRSGLDWSEKGSAESESAAGKPARRKPDERKGGGNSNFMV